MSARVERIIKELVALVEGAMGLYYFSASVIDLTQIDGSAGKSLELYAKTKSCDPPHWLRAACRESHQRCSARASALRKWRRRLDLRSHNADSACADGASLPESIHRKTASVASSARRKRKGIA